MHVTVSLDDGSTFEAEYGSPTLQDSLAWERQFSQSFLACERAARESREAEEEGRAVDPTLAMRTEWLLFFAWQQLRRANPGQVPSKFDVFCDRIADVKFAQDDIDEVDGVDPTNRADVPDLEAPPI